MKFKSTIRLLLPPIIIMSIITSNAQIVNNNTISNLIDINTTFATKIDNSTTRSQSPNINKHNCSEVQVFDYDRDIILFDRFKSGANDTLFSRYSHGSLRKRLKAIGFSNCNKIPDKFKIFENVEHVFIVSNLKNDSIYGLGIFPKLKTVRFYGGVTIDGNEQWLQTIEGIRAEKGTIRGLASFIQTPNLKDILLTPCGFDPFPSDIESLQYLQSIVINCKHCKTDLTSIDLSKLPCLIKMWISGDSIQGFPIGIDWNRKVDLHINHTKLNE